MSFKREGNDTRMLDNLRRRRVRELLADDIPEDEAKLLCNGRYSCLVCKHNPVFDTINMLMVHRHGKKHAASEEEFLRKKKELQTLIFKRKHEQYTRNGTTSIKQAATTSGGIKSAQPYNPCVKKPKVKPYERRPRLDLLQSEPASSTSQCQSSSSSAAASNGYAFTAAVPTRHTPQLKNIFRLPQQDQRPVQPYVRQHPTFTNTGASYIRSHQVPPCVLSDGQSLPETVAGVDSQHSVSLPSNTSSMLSRSGLNKVSSSTSRRLKSSSSSRPSSTFSKSVSRFGSKQSVANSQHLFRNVYIQDCSTELDKAGGSGVQSNSQRVEAIVKMGCGNAGSSSELDTTEKKKLAQKYHHISGSGWKKDWDGKWIRDDEAEFESDEGPPDLP